MLKLAVSPSSPALRGIRIRHLQPRSKPSRCASSHAHTHHDTSRSPSNPNLPPLIPAPRGFDFKYSFNDDLSPKHHGDHKPNDERILKLGKTLRTLSPLLPAILTNPLPPHILSPSVTLHLFPSTHPHLPTVKGRTLYRAALWAVPVAWSSVPLLGNVKLQVLSERIVRAETVQDPRRQSADGCGDERLVVRWRTEQTKDGNMHSSSTSTTATSGPSLEPDTGPSNTTSRSSAGINKGLSVLLGGDAPIFKLSRDDQFTGLFIFSFDEEGRVLTQTIEHAEDASGWERTAKFVTLTDWLIGKARGSLEKEQEPGLCCTGNHSGSGVDSGLIHEQDHARGRSRFQIPGDERTRISGSPSL